MSIGRYWGINKIYWRYGELNPETLGDNPEFATELPPTQEHYNIKMTKTLKILLFSFLIGIPLSLFELISFTSFCSLKPACDAFKKVFGQGIIFDSSGHFPAHWSGEMFLWFGMGFIFSTLVIFTYWTLVERGRNKNLNKNEKAPLRDETRKGAFS